MEIVIIEQVFLRQRKDILCHLSLRICALHPQQQAWLPSKNDLIKLSANLDISSDPWGPGYWRFVEVALG